eukprot:777794-Rhodomonas_salina.1
MPYLRRDCDFGCPPSFVLAWPPPLTIVSHLTECVCSDRLILRRLSIALITTAIEEPMLQAAITIILLVAPIS